MARITGTDATKHLTDARALLEGEAAKAPNTAQAVALKAAALALLEVSEWVRAHTTCKFE